VNRKHALKVKQSVIWGYMAPGVLWYAFMVIVPLCIMIGMSFFDWRSVLDNKFIGLGNYKELFSDRIFKTALLNNLKIILICLVGQVGLGFIVSLLVNSKVLKFAKVHRVAIFLPVILSTVVVGFMWSIVYNNDFGIVNEFFRIIGRPDLARSWLDNPDIVIFCLAIPLIWQYIGYNMVIFLAGLQGIPTEVLEVAAIDGANAFQRARYITLPLMKNTFFVVIMLCISGNMKIFDHIYIMTNGGPGSSSMVLALYAYKMSFGASRFGYANTVSVSILVISLALIFVLKFLLRGEKDE
jgi:raffinose/stachyose/melibiose transport system permease protein